MPVGFVGRHALAQKEVVEHLIAIVVILGLRRIVIADARIDRNAVQEIAIRLVEREEPVVVFVAVIADRQPEQALAGIDVVAGRQHEADVVRVDGQLQRVADLALPLGRDCSCECRRRSRR